MLIDSRADRRRRRELARTDRAGIWVRRQNQAERLHVLRANWRSFAGMLVVASLVIAGVALLIPIPFMRGVFVGVGGSIALGAVAYIVVALSGTVPLGMGVTAEAWTASELRRLRKRGWMIVNGVPLQGRDVDHVLVGPGGVVVVESKWSAYGWRINPADDQVRAAIRQVTANARSLRLWDGVKVTGAAVQPVVFLWGGSRVGAPERPREPVRVHEDTTVAYGLVAIRRWLDSLTATTSVVLTDAEVHQVWRALDHVVRERERVDEFASPPPSLDRVLWTAIGAIVVFVGAVLVSLELLVVSRSWWIWAAGTLALLAAGVLARRWHGARLPAIGGLLGLAVAAVLAAVGEVVVLLR